MRYVNPRSFMLVAVFNLFVCWHVASGSEETDLAKYWHNFRGPTGNGISETAKPPTKWSSSDNVAWKTEIPGSGLSSPVVWGDKVFLATAINTKPTAGGQRPARMSRRELTQKFDEDGNGQLSDAERQKARDFMNAERKRSLTVHQFVVICIDRESGKIDWKDVAAERKPQDGHHQDHGYASASPVTDGQHVYFSFGTNGIFAYDFDGNQIWKRTDLGEMQTRGSFGEGSSLALHEDILVLPWDHEGQSRIETLDKKTGKTKWSVDRDEPTTWVTPRVVTVNGRKQIIQSGEHYTRGYDLETGKELWRSSGLSTRPVSSPVVKGNIGYFASSRRGATLNAYYLDKEGDISNEPAWKIDRQTPDCPSLLLSDNRLYYVSANQGIISCANADDGSEFFGPERLPGFKGIYSSPVAADGKVFVTGRGGKTVVIEDSSEFKVISQNDIGENVDATLALAGDQIFIRGAQHLFCIQEEK